MMKGGIELSLRSYSMVSPMRVTSTPGPNTEIAFRKHSSVVFKEKESFSISLTNS